MKNVKIPRIKITESPNEWTTIPFEEVFLTLPNNTLSRAELNAAYGVAKNIHYGDVLVKYGEHIDTSVETLPYICNAKVVSAFERSKLANGDVVIADTAEDETAGKCVEINGIKDDEIILSGLHTILCRPVIKFAQGYLGYFMNSPAYHKQLIPLMQGTKVTSISKEALKETNISFPSNVKEQSNIVRYLDGLSESIEIGSLRHTKLLALKKSLLQKMFPQEGERVPRIRFDGFEGEWRYTSLRQVAQKVMEKNANREYTETFTNSAEFGIISQRDYFDHDIANTENINTYYIVCDDDFIYNPRISKNAPVGPIKRNKLGRTGIMSPLYTVFRTHNVDNAYLEWFFNSSSWHSYMYFNGDSGARYDRFSIKSDVFFDMPVPLPSLPEQKAIGTYFDNLDTLIEAQEQKITKLQQMKSALFQKMFV